MIDLTATRRLVVSAIAARRMVVALTVRTAAVIVAAIGNRLHFYAPECSAWLGVI